MKKLLQFFSYLIPILLLGGFWVRFPVGFSANTVFFILYAVCFLFCPLLGLVLQSKFGRGALATVSILAFGCGIPASLLLGGILAAQVVLALGCICLGILLVSYALPQNPAKGTLLTLRGVKPGRIRKTLLLRNAYAFFFERSGILSAFIAVWLLLLSGEISIPSLWNSALLVAITGFIGYLLYLILGAPKAAIRKASPKKSRYVFISLLVFILLISVVYVYIGSMYTAPDPALFAALRAVQSVLTPALLSAGIGLPAGFLLGFLLSFCGARFWHCICRSASRLPAALATAFLFVLLPWHTVALAIPLCFDTAAGFLENRFSVRPYRLLPMAGRTKAVTLPLFHLANLALLPRIGLMATFSAIFIDITSGGILLALSEVSLWLAATILIVILSILYILCFLTKEVRHHA